MVLIELSGLSAEVLNVRVPSRWWCRLSLLIISWMETLPRLQTRKYKHKKEVNALPDTL